ARPTFRSHRGRTDLSGSLGRPLGRHAYPWHHEAPSRRDVCREPTRLGPALDRTVSLLPVWRAHGPSRWLCRSRGGLLRGATWLDWPSGPGAVERAPRPTDGSEDRAIAAGALASPTPLASHRRP